MPDQVTLEERLARIEEQLGKLVQQPPAPGSAPGSAPGPGRKEVEFANSHHMARSGITLGTAMVVIVPAVVLIFANSMTSWMQMLIILTALIVGGLVALVSVFFGMVMPSRVSKDGNCTDKMGVGIEIDLGRSKPKPEQNR